jgi:putative ABC transport system permease protein
MLKNYIAVALRNLKKHQLLAFINITGLTLGITCCLIIFLYIQAELSYDSFHKDIERTFRVLRTNNEEGVTRKTVWTSGPFATGLLTDFPAEIEQSCRVREDNGLVTFGEKSFQENKMYFADSNFFTFFSYPLIQGNPKTLMNEPNSIVLSKPVAKKYFGDTDPVGKVLVIDKQLNYKVTGVFDAENIPSHLQFDMVANIDLYKRQAWFTGWWNNAMATYIKLKPEVKAGNLEKKFPAFMDKYFGEDFKRFGKRTDLTLEPLAEIYLGDGLSEDFAKHGDMRVIYIFAAVGLFVLIIACINFMNLATARSIGRAREVGLRKVLGAYRSNLIRQFMTESFITVFISVLIACLLASVSLPYFNGLLETTLAFDLNNFYIPLFLAILVIIVGAASGSYPALYLSSFLPVKVLKGKLSANKQNIFFRQGLVVVQFGISVTLIIATLFAIKQLDFIQRKNLGFDKSQVIIFPINNQEIRSQRFQFRAFLENEKEISSVSFMSGEPGGFHDNYPFKISGKGEENFLFSTVFTDFNYLKTLKLNLVAGRTFDPAISSDSSGMIINEAGAKQLGLKPEEAIGIKMTNMFRPGERTIIGVVKDYHFQSLKNQVKPIAVSISNDHRTTAIRIHGNTLKEGVEKVKALWEKTAPGYPFEYSFLDQKIGEMYKSEEKQKMLMTIFASFAIVIACLGLFGLASFTIEQRTREIGIRKVLGASVPQISLMLSRDFLKPVFLAILIATPAAWFAVNKWLENFAYRTGVNAWIFVIAGLLAVLIALITILSQTTKAGLKNPVETLKSE